MTSRRIFTEPTSPATVWQAIDALLGAPAAMQLRPGERHWPLFRQLAEDIDARGNDIAVQIADDPNNAGAYTVTTFIDSITRDEQEGIVNVEDIQNNDWVAFSGSGAITAAAGG